MIELLHRFYWEEARLRGKVYLVIAVAGICYACVRSLMFHAPDKRVAFELMVFLLVMNLSAALLYCLRCTILHKDTISYRMIPLPVVLKFAGIAAVVALLVSPRLSVSTVQAAVVNQRLRDAASSVEPRATANLSSSQLNSRFQKIAAIADTSISYGIRARPDLVNKVQDNLAETLKSKSNGQIQGSGAKAFVALMAYAQYNKVAIALNVPKILLPHGETGNSLVSQVPLKNGATWWQGSQEGSTIFATPEPVGAVFTVLHSTVVFNEVNFRAFTRDRSFVDTDGESNVVIMNATVTGATQKLDSIVWMNVHFVSSRIVYHGGSLFLNGVTFENCQFDFGPDSTSQKLLSQIKEANSVAVTAAYW